MSSVLLTGANGFVAVNVLQTLLDKGCTVVGTVRSESKTNFLREKFSPFVKNGTLKFAVVPDITVPGAFDEVLKEHRFDAVVHTSSPFYLTATDIQTEMLDPPIKGTTGILESVFKLAPTVKRIVITATFANIQSIPKGDWPGGVYTEEDWSPVKLDEVSRSHPILGYVAGKLYAEKAAFDFVKEKSPNFSVTTLCPPMVFGPPEQELTSLNNLNQSNTDIYDVFNGTSEPRYGTWVWVDVRDLARAHVAAIDSPAAANQRYLLSAGNYSPQAIADYIWEHYPERAAAKGVKKGNPGRLYPDTGVFSIDNSKSVRDLGIVYNDFNSMMKDTLEKFEKLELQGK
ncbi:hypothetical protein M407DRAFT_221003 [Tulasnella calospora MUT 4182]|uniref:NAD-dependent epimerase/dehydratase domain-containing protein n=1 Tax=Tulasnella calospora MUT 4182 TaxID=1051891 RepID=A0A0C3QSY6_9AGAM|nr:hypothetical protein M407DRAFT_221003 [Tulasnella calospora MUT 4182]